MQPGWEVRTGDQVRVSWGPAVNTLLLGALNTSTPTLTWGLAAIPAPAHQCHTQDTELSAPLSVAGSCSPTLQLRPPYLSCPHRAAGPLPSSSAQPRPLSSGPCSSLALRHLLSETGSD